MLLVAVGYVAFVCEHYLGINNETDTIGVKLIDMHAMAQDIWAKVDQLVCLHVTVRIAM